MKAIPMTRREINLCKKNVPKKFMPNGHCPLGYVYAQACKLWPAYEDGD